MKVKIFIFTLLLGTWLLAGALLKTQAAATTEELIPTEYEGLYIVPFSETNPPPPELIAKPQPTETVAETKPTVKTAPPETTAAATAKPVPEPSQAPTTRPETPSPLEITDNKLTNAALAPTEPLPLKELPRIVAKKVLAATAENNIVKNLPTPRSVEFTAANTKRQINLSLWLFFLVGLSATVINEVVKKINESPNRLRAWWKNKLGNWSNFSFQHPLVRKFLVLAALLGYGALIAVAEAPDTLASGLATLAPVLAAALIFLLIKEGGEKIFLARDGANSLLIFSGAGLIVLLLGVFLSRGANLLPPLILSAPLIIVSLNTAHNNEVLAKAKTVALTLAALTAFWFSSYFDNPLWQGAALLICAIGIQDLFFSLIPLNPLPGHAIFKNNFWTWLILFILTTLGFVFIILSPNNATGALTVPWTSAAIYAGAAAVIWLSLKMSGRQTKNQR